MSQPSNITAAAGRYSDEYFEGNILDQVLKAARLISMAIGHDPETHRMAPGLVQALPDTALAEPRYSPDDEQGHPKYQDREGLEKADREFRRDQRRLMREEKRIRKNCCGAMRGKTKKKKDSDRTLRSFAGRKTAATREQGTDMNTDMKDKVAVVTGGSSGIGLASAAAFLQDGAKVAICGRNQARLDEAASELAQIAGAENVLAVVCDVLNEDDVETFRDRVAETFGRCDTLVCNAGEARASNFYTTSDQDWRDEFDLKFFSVLRPARAFEKLLAASGAGSIVITSAMLARAPEPFLIATGATRAGQLNLMKSLSREFAPDIRVNAVLIGLVDSGQWSRRYESGEGPDGAKIPDGMSKEDWFAELAKTRHIPLARLGEPAEAANAILFFGSSVSSYITGETIDVTGGQARNV